MQAAARFLISMYLKSPVKPFRGFLLKCFRKYRYWQRNKTVLAKVDGVRYYLDLNESIDSAIYYFGFWEPQSVAIVRRYLKRGMTVLDIGANIGDKTEVFLRLGGAVVVVEPQESCWRFLRRRFQDDDVKIVTKALDKTAGSKEIFIDRSHTLSSMSPEWINRVRKSSRFSTHKWSYRITVETTTLDELIEEYGIPAFCKIDVEGFEFEVLQGLSQPIVAMSFEFVPEYLAPVLSCVEHLSKLGEMTFNYCLGDSTDFSLSSWADADEIINALNSLPNELTVQGDVYVRSSSSEFER